SSSDRENVATLARDLAELLPPRMLLPHGSGSLVANLARLDRDRPLTWSSAVQRYLAISALSNSLPDADDGHRQHLATSLRRLRAAHPDSKWRQRGEDLAVNRPAVQNRVGNPAEVRLRRWWNPVLEQVTVLGATDHDARLTVPRQEHAQLPGVEVEGVCFRQP